MFNNGSLGFVDLEMKVEGLLDVDGRRAAQKRKRAFDYSPVAALALRHAAPQERDSRRRARIDEVLGVGAVEGVVRIPACHPDYRYPRSAAEQHCAVAPRAARRRRGS